MEHVIATRSDEGTPTQDTWVKCSCGAYFRAQGWGDGSYESGASLWDRIHVKTA